MFVKLIRFVKLSDTSALLLPELSLAVNSRNERLKREAWEVL